jgi:hypothetical protein
MLPTNIPWANAVYNWKKLPDMSKWSNLTIKAVNISATSRVSTDYIQRYNSGQAFVHHK